MGCYKWKREAGESVSIRGMQHRKTSMATVDFENGREPWTKKFGHPVEARKKKKNGFFSKASRKNATPADTLILAQWDSFQILDLQNSKIVCLYHFKPPNYGDFCSKQKLRQPHVVIPFLKNYLLVVWNIMLKFKKTRPCVDFPLFAEAYWLPYELSGVSQGWRTLTWRGSRTAVLKMGSPDQHNLSKNL